jgi:hypothetical protein
MSTALVRVGNVGGIPEIASFRLFAASMELSSKRYPKVTQGESVAESSAAVFPALSITSIPVWSTMVLLEPVKSIFAGFA